MEKTKVFKIKRTTFSFKESPKSTVVDMFATLDKAVARVSFLARWHKSHNHSLEEGFGFFAVRTSPDSFEVVFIFEDFE